MSLQLTTHRMEHVLPDVSQHSRETRSQQVKDTARPAIVLPVFLQVIDELRTRITKQTSTDTRKVPRASVPMLWVTANTELLAGQLFSKLNDYFTVIRNRSRGNPVYRQIGQIEQPGICA